MSCELQPGTKTGTPDDIIADGAVAFRMKSIRRLLERWHREDALHRYTFYVFCLLGLGLRIGYVFQPVRLDEAYIYLAFAGNPLKVALTYYPVPGNHLLLTFLSHVSTRLFGNNVVALRLPSLLAGIVVVPLTYLVFRKIANKETGLLAMGLVAVSSNLINYATQARGYMLQTFLLLALIFIGTYLIETNRISLWFMFTIVGVLGLCTMPTFLYFYPPVLIWVFASRYFKHYDRPKLVRRSFLSLAGTIAATMLVYAPAVISSGFNAFVGDKVFNSFMTSLSWPVFLKGVPKNLSGIWTGMNVGIPLVFRVFLILGLLVGILLYHRLKAGYNLPLIFLAWIALVYLVQRQAPFPRVFIPLIPVFMGIAAFGLEATWKFASERWRAVTHARLGSIATSALLGICLVILVSSVVFIAQGPYQLDETGNISIASMRDGKNVVAEIKKILRPGDMVFAQPGFGTIPLQYYFRQAGIPSTYLVETIAQQSDWEKNPLNIFEVRTFNPMQVNSIKRAIFVTAFREGQSSKLVNDNAVNVMWLDIGDFSGPTWHYSSDWAEVYSCTRLKPAPPWGKRPVRTATGSLSE